MNFTNLTIMSLNQTGKYMADIDLMKINQSVTSQFWGKNLMFVVVSMLFVMYMYLRLRFYYRTTTMQPAFEMILDFFDDYLGFIILMWGIIVLYTLGYTTLLWLIIGLFSLPLIIKDVPFYRQLIVDVKNQIQKWFKENGK